MLVSMLSEKKVVFGVLFCLASSMVMTAQNTRDAVVLPSASGAQTDTDEYTRYELLAPESASFKIYYEVTATTAGAKFFYNPIRKGSVASDESVFDAMGSFIEDDGAGFDAEMFESTATFAGTGGKKADEEEILVG